MAFDALVVAKAAVEERELYKIVRDKKGEANCLYQAADAFAEAGEYAEALRMAEEAQGLFLEIGDDEERAAVLRTITQFHLAQQENEMAVEAAETALRLSMKVKHTQGEAEMLLLIARVNMEMLENTTDLFSIEANAKKVLMVVRKAVKLANNLGDQAMESDALWIYSRAALVQRSYHEAAEAAGKAAACYRAMGDPENQAHMLVIAANSNLARQDYVEAWAAASNALMLFRQLGDDGGQRLAEMAIDAIDDAKPVTEEGIVGAPKVDHEKQDSAPRKPLKSIEAITAPMQSDNKEFMTQQQADVRQKKEKEKLQEDPEKKKKKRPVSWAFMQMMQEKMRLAVSDMSCCDDTPLMSLGVTQVPKLLIRNQLANGIPSPDVWEVQAWHEQLAPELKKKAPPPSWALAAMDTKKDEVGTGVATSAIRLRVTNIVEDIVGIPDIGGDSPLMMTGMTSQSAVLLRESLTKEFPGPSLPFTMMFDHPSINALSEYLGTRIN